MRLPLAVGLLAVASASAVTDGTSNTLMTARSHPPSSCLIGITAIEFKSSGFMDYTDDACIRPRA